MLLYFTDTLYLNSNQIKGTIPTELGNLKSLRKLLLYAD